MTNPLDAYPAVRRVLYLLQWLTTGATGVLGVIFAAGDTVPEWYTITVAVLAFIWTYTGITAQGNVDTLNRYQMGERTIVTACPHCFNSIGNEYGQLGGHFRVIHHAAYLREAVRSAVPSPCG